MLLHALPGLSPSKIRTFLKVTPRRYGYVVKMDQICHSLTPYKSSRHAGNSKTACRFRACGGVPGGLPLGEGQEKAPLVAGQEKALIFIG